MTPYRRFAEIVMTKFKLIGAALALTLSTAAGAVAADCCADMACCKEGADCCDRARDEAGVDAGHPVAAPQG
ncbi:MAG TPA: hypothetical protein VF592_05945 [Sphingomonas sp.]|uniref:hypothetical protein n=1 Tax=Sphingomonas sp. TaxID=28214 RepID=UPI002ED91A72